jgi:hypothetical protein
MSTDRNTSVAFLFLDFKFVHNFNNNTDNVSIWNVRFQVLHNTCFVL